MPVLYRASAAYLLRHPWQLGLALLGIGIGVAVIVAVDLAIQSSRKAFLLSMHTLTGAATYQVIGGPRGVPESLYRRLRVDHGMRNIAPIVAGQVQVGDTDVELLGVDLFAERGLRSFSFDVTAGAGAPLSPEDLVRSFLTAPGAALISQHTARALGLHVGESFQVRAAGRTFPATVLGIMGGSQSAALNNLLVVDIAVAQTWLNQPGRLSRIDVHLAPDDHRGQAELERLLPAGTQLLDAAGRTRALTQMSAAFMTNLSAMSLLALLVGLFLIYNSVGFAVLQRRGLLGVLRALGVTRGQVFSIVLGESAVLGLLGATAGVVLGIALGDRLLVLVARSINDFYFRVNVTTVTVSAYSIAKGLTAGLGATLLAAAIPAAEAASWRPRLALSRSVLERRSRRLLPLIAAAGLVTAVLALLLLHFSGKNLVAGLSAVFMLILGFATGVPLAVRAVTAVLAPLAARLGGTGARLAVSGIGANLSRTGIAIVALAVAVSATIGVSVMVDSFRDSVAVWLDHTLQSDLYVGVPDGALDPAVIAQLAQVSGVAAYSTTRRVWLEDPAGRLRMTVLGMPPGKVPGTQLLDGKPDRVWPAFGHDDAVLVSEPYAYRHAVSAGDRITLMTAAGRRAFTIAAVYRSYDVNAGALLMSRHTYDRFWHDPAVNSVGLFLRPGADAAAVLRQLRRIGRQGQQLVIRSNREIRALSLDVFDRTFVITNVLYWLATGVALIGILGAMLALQLERARELAVLRALGMTPAQLGGMVTLQTAAIGLLSGLAAVPLGLVMAWVLIDVINRRAFGWQMNIEVSAQVVLTAILFATVAALLAGIYPAWRAARSVPALAMREE